MDVVERVVEETRQLTRANADQPLPEGWLEHTDMDGNPYFFKLASRQLSWVRPAQPSPGADEAAEAGVPIGHVMVPGLQPGGAGLLPGGAGLLPMGWAQCMDEESGCPYWVHAASRRSVWVPPPPE